MAINLKEYVRESIIPYLKKIKATYDTKAEVDTKISNKNASNINLDAYTKPTTGGAIGTTDPIQTAIGKLEKGLEDATAGGGEANVQSDWAQADTGSDDYIKNKPDLSAKADLVSGKVPTSQLPDSVIGGLEYKGTWDATTAAPAHDEKGWYYIVSVDGNTDLSGITDWKVGDWAVWNGAAWDKIDNTESVQAVTGDSIIAPFTAITQTEADNDFNNA